MKTQQCPKCGEENPSEAVMCWACYTPLGRGRIELPSQPQSGPLKDPNDERPALKKLSDALSDSWPFLVIAGLAASGWLGRRAGLPVLGAGLAILGGALIQQEWSNRATAPHREPPETEDSPIVRIAQTIFFYAFKENSSAIRLRNNGRGVTVDYQIEGEWHEQMKIPIYVWVPLRHQLLQYARAGEVRSRQYVPEENYAFRCAEIKAHLKTDSEGETLRLDFENAAPGEAKSQFDALPDIYCQHCHADNAPGAVWCWNCYTPIEAPVERRCKESAAKVAMLAVVGALASSGWWPRRVRPWVVGVGALGMAAPLAWNKWETRQKPVKEKRETTREGRRQGVANAEVLPLADYVLMRGFGPQSNPRGAKIRLQEHDNVVVSHQVEGEWHQDTTWPPYVWPALRGRLLQLAREGFMVGSKAGRRIRAQLRGDAHGETLELTVELAD